MPYVDEAPDADPLAVLSTQEGPWQNRHPGSVLSDLQQARRSLGATDTSPGALFVATDAFLDQLADDGYRVRKAHGRLIVYPPKAPAP